MTRPEASPVRTPGRPRSPPHVSTSRGTGPAIGTSTTSEAWRSSSFHTALSPCIEPSSPNRLRANASGCPRPSAYAHAASGASPRPASSARTVSARTPGWSPSISTSKSACAVDRAERGRDRRRAALAEIGVLDLSVAPVKSTPGSSRLTTHNSCSNRHSRATSSTWPSSVPDRYGSSCLGWPRRFEPPPPAPGRWRTPQCAAYASRQPLEQKYTRAFSASRKAWRR